MGTCYNRSDMTAPCSSVTVNDQFVFKGKNCIVLGLYKNSFRYNYLNPSLRKVEDMYMSYIFYSKLNKKQESYSITHKVLSMKPFVVEFTNLLTWAKVRETYKVPLTNREIAEQYSSINFPVVNTEIINTIKNGVLESNLVYPLDKGYYLDLKLDTEWIKTKLKQLGADRIANKYAVLLSVNSGKNVIVTNYDGEYYSISKA